nr:alpha/beta hydrolase [Sporomusa silvacetica]
MAVYSIPSTISAAEQDYWVETKTIQMQDDFINYYLLFKENNGDRKKDNLIIYLNGSDLTCALGRNLENKAFFTKTLVKLNEYSSSEYAMLIPDKTNIAIGQGGGNDMKVMSHYTLQERVVGSAMAIDDFLSVNDYNSVFLVGASEGGAILPKVYNSLKYKEKVSKLVMLAGGGLSQYEEFKLLQKTDLPMPAPYRSDLKRIDAVMADIKAAPDALDKTYMGWPYRRWSGFMSYRPIDELVKIDIPVLVVHGGKDINTPVESSRLIAEEFSKHGKPNLTYIEYKNWDHYFSKEFDIILKDMANWLETDLAK